MLMKSFLGMGSSYEGSVDLDSFADVPPTGEFPSIRKARALVGFHGLYGAISAV